MQQRRTQNSAVEITWAGKPDAMLLAATPCAFRMVRDTARSSGAERNGNLLIEGDNLDALKLLKKKGMSGGFGVVYIDPPYNTGNGFAYRDRRDHGAWLSMMLPRLMLARELMRDDAAIFVSIDDHEIDKLRLLMSEVFGEDNFVAQICVQSNPRGRQADKHFATVHEYLVVYAKDHAALRLVGAELTDEQAGEYSGVDDSGRRYRLLGLRQRGAASLREDRPAMYYPLFVDPETGSISIQRESVGAVEVLPKKSTGQAGRWMWGRAKAAASLDSLEARMIARRGEWDIFVRDYLDDENGNCRKRKLKTIWDEKELNYQNGKRQLKDLLGEAPVDYPKPTALIRKILAMVEDKDALCLDFFAGTGTLAQAVLEANTADGGSRKFVVVQLAEAIKHSRFSTIADVCYERLRRFIESNGGSFDYYSIKP